jgi:hypothetical protein
MFRTPKIEKPRPGKGKGYQQQWNQPWQKQTNQRWEQRSGNTKGGKGNQKGKTHENVTNVTEARQKKQPKCRQTMSHLQEGGAHS